jgi:diaminopimelate decarboxylase
VQGLHVHVGSQLGALAEVVETVDLLAAFAARTRGELGWTPELVNTGGGFAVRHLPSEPDASLGERARDVATAVRRAWAANDLPPVQLALEPGRALVGRAGVTLYRVRTVKRLDGVTWAAVDGGMSENPRPQLYGARYTALAAARADEPPTENVSVAGLHCESGDVLIDDVSLPPPRRGDLLAIPATGGYSLALASNYNATPRPAVVLVRGGDARLIRRRETVDDLLALEQP